MMELISFAIMGMLTIDHHPVGEQMVALISSSSDSIVQRCVTDKNGLFSFSVQPSDAGTDYYVCAKVAAENVAVFEWQKVSADKKDTVHLDVLKKELCCIHVKVKSKDGYPAQ